MVRGYNWTGMLFEWENRGLWREHQPVQLDPHTIWNILYHFFENDEESEKRMNLGNKERPTMHIIKVPLYNSLKKYINFHRRLSGDSLKLGN